MHNSAELRSLRHLYGAQAGLIQASQLSVTIIGCSYVALPFGSPQQTIASRSNISVLHGTAADVSFE
jgi:hypothetical protein